MTVRDPICGMEINSESASTKREYMGQIFYFCSRSCADLFDKDPHRYMTTSAATGFNPERTLSRIELPLSGSPSNGHSTHLESALRALPGVGEVKVNTAAGRLEVAYETGKVDVTKIVQTVKSEGYQVGAQTRIGIENLRCASCVREIENELKSTLGVLNAPVNVATQEATVEYLPQQTTMSQLNNAIETWGYKPLAAGSDKPVDTREEAMHVSIAS